MSFIKYNLSLCLRFTKRLLKFLFFTGIGLHSGKEVKIKIFPGKADHGIIFKELMLKK